MIAIGGVLVEAGYWALVVLGVGLLIFIHELGHFAVAKWSKVKVLAFSLGFGPVLFGFRRGDTHYRLSAIPLGGYVKMSGEVERAEGGFAPEDFPAKPLPVRALIMLAGVVMNAVLAFALYAGAFAVGVRLTPPRVGAVTAGSPAWHAGIRPGDLVLAADGRALLEFADLQHASLAGRPLDLEIERDGTRFRVRVEPRHDERAGSPVIGVAPHFGNRLEVSEGTDAWKAGLRTGDVLVAVEGIPADLQRLRTDAALASALPLDRPLRLEVRREGTAGTITVEAATSATKRMLGLAPHRHTLRAVRAGSPAEAAGFRAGQRVRSVAGSAVGGERGFQRAVLLAPPGPVTVEVGSGAGAEGSITLTLPAEPGARLDLLADLEFAEDPSPTATEVLPAGPHGPSPAAAAGIPTGARIERVNGAAVTSWKEDVLARIAAAAEEGAASGAPVIIEWARGAERGTARVTPAPYPDHFAPAGLALRSLDDRPLVRVSGIGEIGARAWAQSGATLRNLAATLRGLFGGSVNSKQVGGVILIGQAARGSAEEGAGRFLWILAMLSMNLAILNLLPIPPLDGGQLALLGVEAVLGRPPSETVVAAAQWVGLFLILGIMGLGLFNDVGRLLGG